MNLYKFLNLFQNAVDAQGEKPLSIQISSYRLDNFVRITFTDNGLVFLQLFKNISLIRSSQQKTLEQD